MSAEKIEVVTGSDARETPGRLLVLQESYRSPVVDAYDADMVMTVPHLVVRELLALVLCSLVLVLAALFFDAPLEELANPNNTPNPAKAPWYFLGLQELLHYYPPLISGVILPGLVILALIVIPYVGINRSRVPLWTPDGSRGRQLGVIAGTVLALTAVFFFTGAYPVWPLIGPTWLIGALMLAPGLLGTRFRAVAWLGSRSLPFWIYVWFLVATVVLTVIGVYFRGPGWTFVLPWRDGLY